MKRDKSSNCAKASIKKRDKSSNCANQKKKKKKDQVRPSVAFWKWHKESRAHDAELKQDP